MRNAILMLAAGACAVAISGDAWTHPTPEQHATPEPHPPGAAVHPGDSAQMSASCPYQTWGWAASIVPLPRATNGMLTVNGTVRVPDGCYRATLIRGGLTQTQPPSQYFALDIDRPQSCIGSQSTRDLPVSAQFPAQPNYQSVVILCRGNRFAQIDRVSRVASPKPEDAR